MHNKHHCFASWNLLRGNWGMPTDRMASIWWMGPNLLDWRIARDILIFIRSRHELIHWPIHEQPGFVLNGIKILLPACWQTQGHNRNTPIWNIICDKHWNVSTRCLPKRFRFKTTGFFCNSVVASVACFWRSIFKNCANQSSQRRMLIGTRTDMTCFISGMRGSGLLLQQPKPIHGHTSLAIFVNLTRHVGILPAHQWVQCFNLMDAPSVRRPPHMLESKFQLHCCYANFGSLKQNSIEDLVWDSHWDSFVDLSNVRSSGRVDVAPVHWNRLAIAVQFWRDLGN